MKDPSKSPLLRRVTATMREHQMVASGDRLVVAISGGPDSVALLGSLVELSPRFGITLVAAHLNHGLRGDDSDLDQECAAEVCRRLGVALECSRSSSLSGGANLEARARAERYAFLADVAARHSCRRIATGHTADDQAETVILRLMRGAGVRGLAGILPLRRDGVVRPLLDCSRSMVLAYLEQAGLPWREDASNQDRRFLRNRVRHELLPLLESLRPSSKRVLARGARVVAADAQLADMARVALLKRVLVGDAHLSVSAATRLPRNVQGAIVQAWLEHSGLAGLYASHITLAVSLMRSRRPSGSVELPGPCLLSRDYDVIRLAGGDEISSISPVDVEIGASQQACDWSFESRLMDRPRMPRISGGELTFMADADRLASELRLRAAQPGDRIIPFGMNGERKLQDVFVDRKVPRRARWGRPVLVAGGRVVWVPGVIRGAEAPVTAETGRVLLMTATNRSIAGA